ncbi:ABC transporter permease [Carnobacterium gallinarum]|uniref:ABC transporter permease n=1 Tax=Carnobacterium gallinarum TaxID=2749 RepID=UPI000554D266|nr:ABC transporter permease [Carnobacterium gallinarum]
MNKTFIVIKKTWLKQIKSIPFRLMIILPIIAVISAIFFIPEIKNIEKNTVIVSGLNEAQQEVLFESNSTTQFKFSGETENIILNKLKKSEIDGFLKVSNTSDRIIGDFYSNNDEVVNSVNYDILQNLSYMQSSLNKITANIDENQAVALSIEPILNIDHKKHDHDHIYRSILTVIVSLVLFLIIIMYSSTMSQEIATEKSSKIIEVILSSMTAKNYFLGKLIGVFLTILTQISIYALFSIPLILFVRGNDKFNFLINSSDFFSNLSYKDLIYQFLFLLLGVILYTIFSGLCGVFSNRIEDASKVTLPIALVTMVSFIFSYMIGLYNPNSGILKVISFVPFISSFSMPIRMINNNVSNLEIVISIIILVFAIVVLFHISALIYTKKVFKSEK